MASTLADRLKEVQGSPKPPVTAALERAPVVPPSAFFWAAAGSFAAAFFLDRVGRHTQSRQVGRWVFPLVAMGVGSGLAKATGPERRR